MDLTSPAGVTEATSGMVVRVPSIMPAVVFVRLSNFFAVGLEFDFGLALDRIVVFGY